MESLQNALNLLFKSQKNVYKIWVEQKKKVCPEKQLENREIWRFLVDFLEINFGKKLSAEIQSLTFLLSATLKRLKDLKLQIQKKSMFHIDLSIWIIFL